MTRRWLFQILPILLGIEAGIASLAKAPTEIRLPFVLGFLLICPGLAAVRLIAIEDRLHQLTLALALSLGISSLISLAAIYAGVWSPDGILLAVIGLTILLALIPSFRMPLSGRDGHFLPTNWRRRA